MRLIAVVVAVVLGSGCTEGKSELQKAGQMTQPDTTDWKAVDRAMRRTGTQQPGGVQRYSMPRSDLSVTVQGVKIRPALSLGSWLAFEMIGRGNAQVMGDLVLTEREHNRVIGRLIEGGITPTAVHKHLPEHSPELWWAHVEARGDPVIIAETARAALSLTGTPPESAKGEEPALSGIDTAAIAKALGHSGKANGGVYQVSVPRAETIRAGGVELPGAMGTATALNFQPTSRGKAAVNGDFVMTAEEVSGVVRVLGSHGIQVVALHNHMLHEQPRLFFLHFWANDDAVKLARGLRAALDELKPGSE